MNQKRMAIEYSSPTNNYGVRVSASNEQRDRVQDTFFTLSVHPNAQPNRYQTADEIFYSNSGSERVGWADLQFPDPKLAQTNTSWNTSLRYDNQSDLSWDLDIGRNESTRLGVIGDVGVSVLGVQDYDASFINAQLKWQDYSFQFFENYGENTRRSDALPDGIYLNKYNTKSAKISNDWNITDKNYLQSEMRYKNIRIIDDPLFNGSGRSEIFSLALRLDAQPSSWRLIGTINYDYFSLLNKEERSYQLAASRPLSGKSTLRSSYSHAIRQPFMLEYFLNISIPFASGGLFQFLGNQDLNFVEHDNMEVGLRSHVNETLTYDLELWHSRTKNFSARGIVSSGPDGIISSFLNIPLEVEQSGITANLNYEISDKLDIQYFLTFQETQLDDAYDTLTVLSDPRDRCHQATPTWFSGFVANYDIREN